MGMEATAITMMKENNDDDDGEAQRHKRHGRHTLNPEVFDAVLCGAKARYDRAGRDDDPDLHNRQWCHWGAGQ